MQSVNICANQYEIERELDNLNLISIFSVIQKLYCGFKKKYLMVLVSRNVGQVALSIKF